MMSRLVAVCALTAVALVAASTPSLGQAPTAGAIRSTLPGPAQAPLRAAPVTAPGRPGRPNISDTGPKILIERFQLDGNEAIDTATLQARLANFTGQKLSLLGIYDAADALTDYYRAQGYAVASVTVPAQKVSDGLVKLVVLEGRIGKVDVQGNDGYSFEFVRERVADIKPGSYLRGDTLERDMLMLNDLPGMSARAVVQPGAAFGDTDVVVQVEEDPYDLIFRVDNHGRNTIGRERVQGDLFLYNPTGAGDQFSISLLSSQGLGIKYGALGYQIPVGTAGTRFSANISRHLFEVETKDFLPGASIKGDGSSYQAVLRHPVIRGLDENLWVSGGVSRDESDTNDGTDTITSDTLNLLTFGLHYDRRHADRSTSQASLSYATNFKRS